MPVERGGFTITVPMSWWEFDIHPATREASIRRLMGQRVRENPALAEHRSTLSKFLNRAARQAYDSGAVYIGCMAQNFGAIPLTATVTVSAVGARTPDGQLLPTDPASIAAGLHEKTARREGDPWRKVTAVEIPDVGPAARTHGIEDVEEPGGGRAMRTVLMQTFIPIPDQPERVALVSCSSGVLDLADSFFDIFDAVTSTFRFTPATDQGRGRTRR
ncbi:hypothetical protein NGB36_24265 [Streptomyces sp. RB6PN25]|uniref:ESX secretion-associated protein EspG n=1 Tax=Streptomyces humicola TaxID=2953240 RepID=A0ABT1Q137_9ACTN|nr:hypothetical protein [Streptomyces humicola]MCQ4083629.1 hypothetical protein [Streptomyces humicola]